jgi:hypothetical protein
MIGDPLTVEELERWTSFGAQWRAVYVSEQQAIVDLCSCTGEAMERRASADPATIAYVRRNRHDPGAP